MSLDARLIVESPAPDPSGCANKEYQMGMLGKLAKGAVAAKVIQIATRELQKPENQAKIRDGLSKLSKNVRPR